MPTCQSKEGCTNRATEWVVLEYSSPVLPKEVRTYLLCYDHLLHARKSASAQSLGSPETGIRIVEHGSLEQTR
jgi:hypothetical protein